MEANALLESYLRQLKLPTFAKNYSTFAADAANQQLDYPRYLLALTEQEINQRQQNVLNDRMKSAHFSVAKELADFDFSAIPSLNKAQVLDLARGEYIRKHESIVLIGNVLSVIFIPIGLTLALH